jgi:hypothetical protein
MSRRLWEIAVVVHEQEEASKRGASLDAMGSETARGGLAPVSFSGRHIVIHCVKQDRSASPWCTQGETPSFCSFPVPGSQVSNLHNG